MESLLLYIIKSAAVLSFFFLAYEILLKNDTSFGMNRGFLLVGILTSFLLPAIEFTRTTIVEATLPADLVNISIEESAALSEPQTFIDWWLIAGAVYALGAGILFLRLLIRLMSLRKFLQKLPTKKEKGYIFLQTRQAGNPFSFFKYIVFNPRAHAPEELEMILKHEQVHASQWHSLDVLAVHVSGCLLWFNPLMWLYKKRVLQNLEYLADRETARFSGSTTAYQKTLVRISAGDLQPLLVNHFYQSFIKKRILMLNKKKTSKTNLWKTGIIIPVLIAFVMGFQVRTEARTVFPSKTEKDSISTPNEFAVTINSRSSQESLAGLTHLFSNRGILLSFRNIEQAPNGKITHIEVTYQTEDGKTGNYHQTNQTGIDPFIFYTRENGETGFRLAETAPVKSMTPSEEQPGNNGSDSLQKLGKKPLIIIGNKTYKTEDLHGKYIQVRGELEVLTPRETRDRFGKKAKDGALYLEKGEIIDDFDSAMKEVDSQLDGVEYDYLHFREGIPPSYVNVKKTRTSASGHQQQQTKRSVFLQNYTFKEETSFIEKWGKSVQKPSDINAFENGTSNRFNISTLENRKPMVVIDGEIQDSGYDVNRVEHDDIGSIDILTNEHATKAYGDRAKNGVIKITTKKKKDIPVEEKKEEKDVDSTKLSGPLRLAPATNNGLPTEEESVETKQQSEEGATSFIRLYIVNGEEMPWDFDPSSIAPKEIESIAVLKSEQAKEKYGEKAAQGVIVITLKEHV